MSCVGGDSLVPSARTESDGVVCRSTGIRLSLFESNVVSGSRSGSFVYDRIREPSYKGQGSEEERSQVHFGEFRRSLSESRVETGFRLFVSRAESSKGVCVASEARREDQSLMVN